VGDIERQTAVEDRGDGRFVATVHADWEIWGPCGGYVAALALRAAGAASHLARPASFFCHYLSVASFAPVDLVVTPLRSGRTVLAQRVAMSQEGRPVLDAMIWSVGEVEGLEHEDVDPPEVPDPDALPTWAELGRGEDRPTMPFWDNFDQRPVEPSRQWPPNGCAPADVARLGPGAAHGGLRGSLGGRGALPHRPRRGELAGGLAPAHVSRTSLHRAEP
jgi:acyl-CoA thioesterase II